MSAASEQMPSDEELAKRSREASQERDREEEFDISRGETAKRLMAEPLLVEAFGVMEKHWRKALEECSADDVAIFQGAKRRLEILELFKLELQHALDTGKMVSQVRGDRLEMDADLSDERRANG